MSEVGRMHLSGPVLSTAAPLPRQDGRGDLAKAVASAEDRPGPFGVVSEPGGEVVRVLVFAESELLRAGIAALIGLHDDFAKQLSDVRTLICNSGTPEQVLSCLAGVLDGGPVPRAWPSRNP